MPIAFLDPHFEVGEGCHLGDVIDKDHGMHIAVVMLDHAFSEAFLTGGVPHLNLEDTKTRIWSQKAKHEQIGENMVL